MEWEIGSLVLVIGTEDLGGELDLSETLSRLFALPGRYRIFARNCIDERFFVSLATSRPESLWNNLPTFTGRLTRVRFTPHSPTALPRLRARIFRQLEQVKRHRYSESNLVSRRTVDEQLKPLNFRLRCVAQNTFQSSKPWCLGPIKTCGLINMTASS
jgi:hypothetical protein